MTLPHRRTLERVDVVVVGGGLVGLAVAQRLAQLGVSHVVVLEAAEPGQQSTGRASGGIRRQFASQLEIEMTQAGLRFFEPILADPEFSGSFEPVGYAFLAGPQHVDELAAAYELQQQMGVSVEWLERSELRSRFPYLEYVDVVGGTYCGDDGFLDAWQLHQYVLRGCRRLGVTIRRHTPVDAIEIGAGRVEAVCSGSLRLKTRLVVIAAGAWSGRVGEMAGLLIPVAPSPRFKLVMAASSRLPPVTPLVVDLTTGAYVRGTHGQVVAGVTPVPTPVGFDFEWSFDAFEHAADRVAKRFPSLRDAAVSGRIEGLYEITPDGLPVAGEVDGVRGLYVAAGFNGHGIMHGPPIAQAVAELIATGRAETFDLDPFSPGRFSAGRSLKHVATLL